eukprot:14751015-Ditylum_brightwellii.AAC.1
MAAVAVMKQMMMMRGLALSIQQHWTPKLKKVIFKSCESCQRFINIDKYQFLHEIHCTQVNCT